MPMLLLPIIIVTVGATVVGIMMTLMSAAGPSAAELDEDL